MFNVTVLGSENTSMVILVMKSEIEIFARIGEVLESLAVCLLLFLPSADDLLSGKFGFDFRALLKFKVGHAEGVGGAGEGIIVINHANNIRVLRVEVKSFLVFFAGLK